MSEVAFITGAGISASAGLSTYRGEEGLYVNPEIEELMSGDGFAAKPEKVWEQLIDRAEVYRRGEVRPTLAHLAISSLQDRANVTVITQNIDELHEAAGSARVSHLHGTLNSAWCPCCTFTKDIDMKELEAAPTCPSSACQDAGRVMHPGVVLFGESLNYGASQELNSLKNRPLDYIFIVGTEAIFPYIQRVIKKSYYRRHTRVVEVNLHRTAVTKYCDLSVFKPADEALPTLLEGIGDVL